MIQASKNATKEDIKDILRNRFSYIEYDIDFTINLMFSVRTHIRKIIKFDSILSSDKLLLNNIIISKNIFGINLSYSIFKAICSVEEMIYINTIYHFLKLGMYENINDYFLELLHHNCNMYIKN